MEPRALLAADVPVVLDTVTAGLASPVVATHAGDGSGRMFVAQQGGTIQVIQDGVVAPTPFLNLGAGGLNRVLAGGERGLLGLAFHPDFSVPDAAGEGKFYVYYSAPATLGGDHDSVVSEFRVSTDPDAADTGSERELLRFAQPFSNHNAGDLHFGPDDGLLYISSGDGGSSGDPQNNAQGLSNLLGKILRIDVDGNNAPGGQYGIPATNPFAGQAGARDEIYAYGFRNPYRFSFDDGPAGAASADRLFVGDVGQGAFEEVDLVTSGGNYGWRIREGAHPFNTNDPDPGNLIDPIAEYPNDATTNAVIGGYVYRGAAFPSLQGRYIFGDLLGRLFVLDEQGGSFSLSDLEVQGGNSLGSIIGFGEDEAGELYVLTFSQLLSIQAAGPSPIDVGSDLDGGNGYTINGIDPDDDSGRSVSSAGDVNADGFDDLLIGADGGDPNGNLSGETYVVFGSPSGQAASLELSALDGTNGFVLNGVNAFDRSGLSAGPAGDLNGDGIDDLLIGALEGSAANNDSGESYVVFGRSTAFPQSIELSSLDGSDGFTIRGAAGDFSGASVASAGDVNGDGFNDVMIGAPYASPNGRDRAGTAYVLFGSPGGFAADVELSSLSGTDGFAVNGISAGDQAGFAVSAAGDVNGDGLDDLIVGSYDASPNGSSSGQSYVVFGSATFAAALELTALDGADGFAINGISAGDYSGHAVSRAGDVNGDGFDDVIVGSYGANGSAGISHVVFGGSGPFAASLELSALDGTNGFAINGSADGDESGRAVAAAGDVNGDGFDDVIIGARYADPLARSRAGESYIVFGQGAAFDAAIELSMLDGCNGLLIQGADADDFLGLAVGGAGDVNGDGFDDVIVGAPAADPGGNSEEGESYVLFGGDFAGSVTHLGDATNNNLVGSAGSDSIVGGQGDDVLVGNGGRDLLRGGQGDDEFVLSDTTFRKISGGSGSDSIRLDGNGITLDLTAIPDNRITDIERIDITGDGGNALVVSLPEVLNLSETSNRLIVRADANDSVDLGAGWVEDGVELIDGEFYNAFRQAAGEVLVLRSEGPAWQNQAEQLDVNADSFVSPIDALVVINELNDRIVSDGNGRLPVPSAPSPLPPPFFDVTGDDFVTPIDALQVINFLNEQAGEGEGSIVVSGISRVQPNGSCQPDKESSAQLCRMAKVMAQRRVQDVGHDADTTSRRGLDDRLSRRRLFASGFSPLPDLVSTSLLDDLVGPVSG